MKRFEAIKQARGPLAMTEANYRKVIAGEKTQTRRIAASNDLHFCDFNAKGNAVFTECEDAYFKVLAKCQLGEIYYLPEPVQLLEFWPFECYSSVKYLWTDTFAKPWITDDDTDKIIARKRGWNAPTTARFMLKSFAREFVRIKSVKVERLQDITPEDAIAEGCDPSDGALGDDIMDFDFDMNPQFKTDEHGKAYVVEPPARPIRRFKHLWNSIHGPGAWDANPWVWGYEFERLEVSG